MKLLITIVCIFIYAVTLCFTARMILSILTATPLIGIAVGLFYAMIVFYTLDGLIDFIKELHN